MLSPRLRVRDDGWVPKERYTGRAFFDAEMERLWPRVWQIACREEELTEAGDYVVYEIGAQSIVLVRTAAGTIAGFHNACLHRGTRLAEGIGRFAGGTIRCPYHGWCYALDGALRNVPDRHEFGALPDDLRLAPVRAESWGGFVFVNMDPDAEPLLDFLDPLPSLLAPYRLHEMRFRSHLTTILPANWKAVIDAFNEGYHVQGAHAQILPWTDDTSIAYEQFRTHAHYGRLPSARRRLSPSPRLGLADGAVDEGDILAALVAGLGGAFLKEERALVEELRTTVHPPGTDLLALYQRRRKELMKSRGHDVSAFDPEQMTSADDVYCFPNVVGPIYPGSAILFRVRPNGCDPGSTIKDTWVLEWPRPGTAWTMPERRFFADWKTRSWGEITTQDYENITRVQLGMQSRGFDGLRLNPRQEGNILHMHRVIDRYLGNHERDRED
jgi:phenylpropionate dioxygenase-like ring-hydroxylating dioxygenase large terminal subunit